MKFIKITIMLAYLLNTSDLLAQSPVLTPGKLETATIGGQDVTFKTTHAYGKVTVYSPSIIRVRLDKQPLGRDFSYAVVGEQQKTKTSITQDDEVITITTDSLKVILKKQPFSVAFYTPDGKLINEDEKGLTTSWAGH